MLKNRILTLSFMLFFTSSLFGQAQICPPENLSVLPGDGQNILMWEEPIDPFTISFNIWIGTDTWAGETSWDLVYVNTGEIVASIAQGDLTENSSEYTWDMELNHGDYIFTIYDSYGDGIYDPGGYILTLGGEEIANVIGWSGTEEIVEFSTTGRFQVSNISFTNPLPFEKDENVDLSVIENWPRNEVTIVDMGQVNFQNLREVPDTCGTFSYYQIYDGNGTALGTSTELEYTHTGLSNGVEACYTITAVYTEGESDVSNSACGTPASWTAEPASNLMSFPGDEQILLTWMAPGGGGGTQGDNMENPFIVTGIPFTDNGTTEGFTDDYDEECPYTGSESNDVVYLFSTSGGTYDFSICESAYDTKLYIYDVNGVLVDCSDDACSNAAGESFRSLLEGINLDAGVFYVIVDGYGSQNGEYQLEISETGTRAYNYSTLEKDDNFIPNDRTEYDFLGYNVYVDGSQVNGEIVVNSSYTVTGLTNEVSYELGVTAVYEGTPNYESVMITATDSPVYLFGDITGVITDPNGATLDSVVVLSGSVSDTTSSDGVYTLWNLETGNQTVTFQRAGFYTEMVDTSVLAQADPTILDYVLSPDMPSPVGLSASPNDHSIDLSWKTPGNGEEMFFQYDDGVLETAFYFYTSYEEGTAHGMRFDVGGGFDLMAASVKILSEGDNYWPWPDETHGPIRVLVFDDNNGVPGNLLHDEETVAENGWATIYPNVGGLNGSVYIIASHAGDWSVEGDPEGFGVDGAVDYPDNMYNYQDGVWTTGDGLGYGGDYMMAVQVMSYGGARTISYASLDNELNIDFVHGASTVDLTHMSSMQNPSPSSPVFNSTFASNFNREDQLVEYKVYEVGESDATLVATTTDTFATITVAANYVEYCFAVKAVWNTDDYGTIESDASNTSCTVPFTSGDADFDSDVDVSDLLSVVDFILEETTPSDDQFRNCDINMDDEINISDVVMMVDIMFGGTAARIADYDPSVMAYVDLIGDISDGKLWLNVDYDQMMRGVQFELTYDPNLIAVHSPQLTMIQDNIMMTSSEKKDGIISILIANLSGGGINKDGDELLYFPIEFLGNKVEVANIKLDNIGIADAKGDLAPTVARGASADFKILPGKYALHQNFPNPFNPVTEIQFDLPEDSRVELAIYNLMGQKINTLISGDMTPGFHTFKWNGKDYSGQAVSSGMYFYSLSSKGFKSTRKMLLLK